MANRRRHMNATILPDGQVLATGGTSGGGFVNINEANAVKAAELWNPSTGQWTTLASSSVMRVYHSVSLLLPDGSVLHGASGDAMATPTVPVPPERNHEIFQPPYLFKGARPTITSAPSTVGYGETFSVATPNAAQVTGVRWIRLGSVTHAFDAGQRANTLSFAINGGNVDVQAPMLPQAGAAGSLPALHPEPKRRAVCRKNHSGAIDPDGHPQRAFQVPRLPGRRLSPPRHSGDRRRLQRREPGRARRRHAGSHQLHNRC